MKEIIRAALELGEKQGQWIAIFEKAITALDSYEGQVRAEERKACAERAIAWYVRTWKIDPNGPLADDISAAILAAEPGHD